MGWEVWKVVRGEWKVGWSEGKVSGFDGISAE